MVNIDAALVLELAPEQMAGMKSVAIDVLRATSTIVAAMDAGLPTLIPVVTLEEARQLRQHYPQGACYLGGERNRLRPPGFDFGNSPADYAHIAEKRPIIFTTTNGTRALNRLQGSSEIYIGSLGNARALAQVLLQEPADIVLVCAGTLGRVATEDVLAAGLIIHEMQKEAELNLSDGASVALATYRALADDLEAALLATSGGRKLAEAGLKDDVLHAARANHSLSTPRFVEGCIIP